MHPLKRLKFTLLATAVVVVLGFASTAAAQHYSVTNLVADVPGVAANTDPNLVNPWGISFSTTSPFWISDNGTGLSTLYNGTGATIPLVVTIPTPPGGAPPSKPTGTVYNTTTEFAVTGNGVTAAAAFLFATEDGTISGWAPSVDLHNAILAVDNSGKGAIYKGLAIATNKWGKTFIYVTNFHDGYVEVYDSSFQWVKQFTDYRLPYGYAPFGIQTINNKLYVTFAKQDADKEDDVAGPGKGFLDVCDLDGDHCHRLASRGHLNAPWGLALAPADFGKFSGDLLVGNFGDGRIHAYGRHSGDFHGTLRMKHHVPIAIDGLWGIAFGNGASAGSTNILYFTAGPDDESHGLFGQIEAVHHSK